MLEINGDVPKGQEWGVGEVIATDGGEIRIICNVIGVGFRLFDPETCAVFSRTWGTLAELRSACSGDYRPVKATLTIH